MHNGGRALREDYLEELQTVTRKDIEVVSPSAEEVYAEAGLSQLKTWVEYQRRSLGFE